MSATTPDVPLHPHTDRWVFRSGGESGRVSRAERREVYGDDEARRACADASEKPDLPWHRTTSSSRILTLRRCRVKAFLSLGEFAHDATAGIFNDYVALQVWAGTPALPCTVVERVRKALEPKGSVLAVVRALLRQLSRPYSQ